jgi:pimeloyl-ACP methyl ester carboxylesterase
MLSRPHASILALPSGVRLEYVVQGRADGVPVVLLHGLGDSWHSWELVLAHLPAVFRVYAVTMRGHGWSDKPASGYTTAEFATDVRQFLEALDLRGVTLVGHSLGSFVAQRVAATARDRLSKLVLVGSAPGRVETATRDAMREAFASLTDPIDPLFARDFQASTVARPVDAAFFETMCGEVRRVPAAAYREIVGRLGEGDPRDVLAAISVPTLLVWGDKDAMMSRADQDGLVAQIKGARLSVYTDTGHAPHWEEPERFARELTAFVRQRAGSR